MAYVATFGFLCGSGTPRRQGLFSHLAHMSASKTAMVVPQFFFLTHVTHPQYGRGHDPIWPFGFLASFVVLSTWETPKTAGVMKLIGWHVLCTPFCFPLPLIVAQLSRRIVRLWVVVGTYWQPRRWRRRGLVCCCLPLSPRGCQSPLGACVWSVVGVVVFSSAWDGSKGAVQALPVLLPCPFSHLPNGVCLLLYPRRSCASHGVWRWCREGCPCCVQGPRRLVAARCWIWMCLYVRSHVPGHGGALAPHPRRRSCGGSRSVPLFGVGGVVCCPAAGVEVRGRCLGGDGLCGICGRWSHRVHHDMFLL